MSEKKEDEYPSEEASSQAESFDASKSGTSETYDMKDFCPGIRIEAKDFDGKWYPAKVSDVDWTENEILVHFENWNTKFDEWIPMDSSRLRPIQKPVLQQKDVAKFCKGEEVMAVWSANQKYPGIIQAVLTNDRYDVLFSDGFMKRLKGHKISKLQGGTIKPEVKTFSDIGTKEERRERKRKINVAELFHINKRSKKKGLVNSKPQDIKTYPVSKSRSKSSLIKKFETSEDNAEGMPNKETREVKPIDDKSIVSGASVVNKTLVDNIPAAFEVKYINGQTEIWSKQLYQRSEGRTAGKLDIVILNPQGRKFRSRNEIMKYCEENGIVYSHEAFDFSAKGRPKSKPVMQTSALKSEVNAEDKEKTSAKKGAKKSQNDVLLGTPNIGGVPFPSEILPQENNNASNKVFIGDYEVVIENGKFICPVKVCGKHFRRENLLHMHMKHYHPEFSKYLDYTPSVTDLAYARTVGNLDAVETPPPVPRKVSGSEKLEKSVIKVETFRKASDVSSESAREAKKLKGDSRVENKNHPVKPLPEVSSASLTPAEDPNEDKKIGSVGLQLGRTSSNLNETETEFQESSGTLPDGITNESTPRNVESSNTTPNLMKPSRHPRLHGRKKSSRFQGSFSEHIRKRRFLSQDRARSHNRLGRQQPSQLPGQQFSLTQPLQTAVSPQPCVEDTISNAPSQGHTMARYLKPHLNISNEISGKNTLLNNSKAVSDTYQKNSENIEKCFAKEEIRRKTEACKRSFLAGLLSARKRNGSRKRWKRKRRNQLRNFELNRESQSESVHIEKPYTSGDKCRNYSCDCSIANTLKTNDICQVSQPKNDLKLKTEQLNMDWTKKNEEKFGSDCSEAIRSCSAFQMNAIKTQINSEDYENGLESTNLPSETKIKLKIDFKELPKPDVLWKTVFVKGNFEDRSTSQNGDDKNAKCLRVLSGQRRGKKRTRSKGQNGRPEKKVRFENSLLEKSIDESEAFDQIKLDSKTEETTRKYTEKKFYLNEYVKKYETNRQKRTDVCELVQNKMTRLDQAEATEDSKSPVAVENDKVEKLRRNEIINCLCGITEEDGLMIQCDICLCWQHGHCAGILRELDVPDKYTCAICKNPYRGRSSMKYLHDQEWLKEGTLPSLSFRSKRNDVIEQRKAILKRTHDLSGSITLLAQVIHSLRIKVNIAEKKDHPKLWLWAKKWTEKKPNRLKEESEVKEERLEEQNLDLNNEVIKKESDSPDEKPLPKAPEPEAPIDSAECRLNLLDHLIHYQSLIDARLSCIESLVAELESMQDDAVNDETPDRYPRTKATVQMILRDLNTMKKVASI